MACYAVIMTIVVDKCCSEVGEALKCVNRKLKCGGHVKTRRLRSFPPPVGLVGQSRVGRVSQPSAN
jgi:hypothetical protein